MADSSIGTIFRLEELNKPYAFDKVERKRKMFDKREIRRLSMFAFLAVAMMLPTLVLPLTATAQENTPTNTPIPPTPTETATETPTDTPIDTPTAGFQTNTPPWPTKTHSPTHTGGPTATPTCDSGKLGPWLPPHPTPVPECDFFCCLDNYSDWNEQEVPWGVIDNKAYCPYCHMEYEDSWMEHERVIHDETYSWIYFLVDYSINCNTCGYATPSVTITPPGRSWTIGAGITGGFSSYIALLWEGFASGTYHREERSVTVPLRISECTRAWPYAEELTYKVYESAKKYQKLIYTYDENCPNKCAFGIGDIVTVYEWLCISHAMVHPYLNVGGYVVSEYQCSGRCCNMCTQEMKDKGDPIPLSN